MKNQKSAIEDVVKKTLASCFSNIRIFKVDLREDVDVDGDRVMWVNVVFEGSPRDLNQKDFTNAVGVLRQKLDEEGTNEAIPLLSFISKAEYQPRAS